MDESAARTSVTSLLAQANQLLNASTKQASEKRAGPTSELLSAMNPLNMYGGGLAGGAAALAMPTRSLRQQAEYDSTDNIGRAIANVLVPGYGSYNGFKRVGAGIRSPEMKAIKAERLRDQSRRELASLQRAEGASGGADDDSDKEAGWKTEMLSTLNPLNTIGGPLGAIAAGLTPTRNLAQQAEADDSTWSNILVPGQGSYNWFKRIGAATRSPEMKAMRRKARIDKLEARSGKKAPTPGEDDMPASKVASAFAFGQKAAAGFDLSSLKLPHGAAMGGLGGAALGAGVGGLAGLINPGTDENGKRKSRLGAALRGALGGGAVGGLGGAAAGHLAGDERMQQFGAHLAGLFGNKAEAAAPSPTPASAPVPVIAPKRIVPKSVDQMLEESNTLRFPEENTLRFPEENPNSARFVPPR